MTKEKIEILENAIKTLPKLTWMNCKGCPRYELCGEEADENKLSDSPPCEAALFELVEEAKKGAL